MTHWKEEGSRMNSCAPQRAYFSGSLQHRVSWQREKPSAHLTGVAPMCRAHWCRMGRGDCCCRCVSRALRPSPKRSNQAWYSGTRSTLYPADCTQLRILRGGGLLRVSREVWGRGVAPPHSETRAAHSSSRKRKSLCKDAPLPSAHEPRETCVKTPTST